MNENDVVDALRESIDGSGWRLAKDVTTRDYKREENKLVLTLVRSSSPQQELPLSEGDDG